MASGSLWAEHKVSGHISGLRLMRRALQRTRRDGNAMCIRRGFPLYSLSHHKHTHTIFTFMRAPPSLSPALLLLCVASIIRIPYSIYTPAAGGAALDKIRRTHRKNKIASQPEEKLHYTRFFLYSSLHIYGCCCCCLGNAAAALEIWRHTPYKS